MIECAKLRERNFETGSDAARMAARHSGTTVRTLFFDDLQGFYSYACDSAAVSSLSNISAVPIAPFMAERSPLPATINRDNCSTSRWGILRCHSNHLRQRWTRIGDNSRGRANFFYAGRKRTRIGIGRRNIASWRVPQPMPMCASVLL